MKLNKSELNKLLSQVTDDVQEMLKHETDEGEALSKADEGEEAPAEKTPEGSSSETPEAPPAPSDAGPPAGPEASASPEGSPEGSPDGAPEGSPDGGDPAADGGATPEALQAEYAQLPPEELKMHFLACKAALMASMSGQPGADDGSAGAPPAGPEASAAPMGPPAGPEASAPVPPAPQFGKKEFKAEGSGGQMSKSEKDFSERLSKAEKAIAEVDELKKSIASKDVLIAGLEENIGKVAEGFKTLLTRQQVMRKSLTGISYANKPGVDAPAAGADFSTMSKSEVVQKLNEVTASPNLSSADRSLITRFVVGENVPVSTVAKFLQ